MRTFPALVLALLLPAGLLAQTPQDRFSYEDKAGTTGHSLTIDGKSFGPYKEIYSVTHSTSATAGLFLVTKRDKTYVLAQGRETGPLASGFEPDQAWISDDSKVWALTALQYDDSSDEGTSLTQLWVNGRMYGPYASVAALDHSETGGIWIASVQVGEEEYEVLLNGKSRGTFASVEHVWTFPDGKGWGYAATDGDGNTTVVTQDRTYEAVQGYNFDQMYPRNPHWALGFRVGDEEELIIIDGKTYSGYLNFSGLYTTYSGRHWGFEAEKLTETGDFPVVVINGKEYVGEGLGTTHLGDRESFTWTVSDGPRVTVQVLTLP